MCRFAPYVIANGKQTTLRKMTSKKLTIFENIRLINKVIWEI